MFETIEIKDVKVELGKLLKVLRKREKLSQIELAKRLNVSRTTIQNIELGKNFTADTFLKVLRELDLLAELYYEVKERKQHLLDAKPLY